MIHHSRPLVTESDIDAVAATLRSGQLAGGEHVRGFESGVAQWSAQRGGVATSSGTAALHLALLALGVGEGDEVIIPSYVCTAVLNAVHHARATAVLCDVDPETGNLDREHARRCFTCRTKAIVVPHMFGHPAEMDWVKECDVPVIEDCAQALGARWGDHPVGSFGVISVFSFYATKVITTGEGGMACSSCPTLLERMRDTRDYDGQAVYRVRYNYKMSDMQASLGLRQLSHLPAMLARRRAIATYYDAGLAGAQVGRPPRRSGCDPIFYRYVVRVPEVEQCQAAFARYSVECKRPVFVPLHHLIGDQGRSFLGTDEIYDRALSLPLYPALQEEESRRVADAAGALLGGPGLPEGEPAARSSQYAAA